MYPWGYMYPRLGTAALVHVVLHYLNHEAEEVK